MWQPEWTGTWKRLLAELRELLLSRIEVQRESGTKKCTRCQTEVSKPLAGGLEGLCIKVSGLPVLFLCNKCSKEFLKRYSRFLQIQLAERERDERLPSRLRWQVFRRDKFKCKRCGRDATKEDVVLRVHHLDFAAGNKLENLETVCDICHP